MFSDFASVTTISYSPHLLATHPSVPVKTTRDLIALARQIRAGSIMRLGSAAASPRGAHVRAAHRHPMGIHSDQRRHSVDLGGRKRRRRRDVSRHPANAAAHKLGKLKLIAVSSEQRLPSLPHTPTVAETPGLDGFVTGTWQGLLAPARTPPEVIAKLNVEVAHIKAARRRIACFSGHDTASGEPAGERPVARGRAGAMGESRQGKRVQTRAINRPYRRFLLSTRGLMPPSRISAWKRRYCPASGA